MSIEVTGPEKYEFQDLVCLRLWLRCLHLNGLKIFIEPPDGEDALFAFVNNNGVPQTIEVQVKGATVPVTMDAVADCLAHFRAKTATDSLLERLLASGEKFVLLQMSGRCTDAAARFAVNKPWIPASSHPQPIRLQDAEDLLQDVGKQYRNASAGVDLERRNRCRALAKEISPANLRLAASRLVIEERVTEDVVKAECETALRSHFLIPNDRLEDAVNALAAVIRNTKYEIRRTGKLIDACPGLITAARRFGANPMRPPDYVPRTDEASWQAALSQHRALLLSGRPRCGKSYAAMYVAAEFQTLGYEVKQGTDVEDASRFLLDRTTADRIYVLDDPLGALQPNADAFRSVEKLRWLIPRLQPNRRLIIAQSQDQLFDVMGASTLKECAIAHIQWQDLGCVGASFLAEVWESMFKQSTWREDVTTVIEPALRSGAVEVELGCLRHLASTIDELPPNPDINQIVQHARQDAKNLGLSLARVGPDMTQFLLALALGSAPGKPLKLQESAFILDRNTTELPGKSLEGGSYLGGKMETEEFPSYPSLLKLSAGVEHQMDILERRRFISVADGVLQFTHPFYRAAAQNVFDRPTSSVAREAVRQFERALFCLSPVTASAAVQNADWLGRGLANHPKEVQEIFGHVEKGMESLFPIVRDQCFEFLLRHLNELDPEQKADRAHWVESALSRSLDDVSWHQGDAWIPSHRNMLESLERELEKPPEIEICQDVEQLEEGKAGEVPPERAARVLKFYSHDPESLSLRVTQALLGFEEALIRARAVRQWFVIERTGDSELIEQVFQDRHPAVILEVFKTCARAWHKLDSQRRGILKTRLRLAAASEAVAVALLPRLVVFDRVEHFGKNPPWELFEVVMPTVFAALPHRASLIDARLYNVMKEALAFCQPEALVSICGSWLEWLKREVGVRYLGEYELSVADILVRATRRNPELRNNIIHDLLAFQASDILIYILRDLQDLWKELRDDERSLIIDVLDSDRADQRWLRAVALTRRAVPAEMQKLILGREDALDAPVASLSALLPTPLLIATVAVQCGKPGVFWNLAHSSKKFDELVRWIERQPSHIAFETAFHEAVLSMKDSRVKAIVESATLEELEKVFWLLLRQRVEWTGNFLPESWALLLSRVNKETRRDWLAHMATAAPACIDNMAEIREWLTLQEDQQSMIELLSGDTTIALLSLKLVRADESERQHIVENICGALEETPPRLFGTCDRLRSTLKIAGVHSKEISARLTTVRELCFAEREEIKSKFKEIETPPSDWISIDFHA
jgi:hypothetical protein